jgi:hypothetical protein
MWIYILDCFFVIKSFFMVVFLSKEKIERRLRFMNDMTDERRKKQLPYRLLKSMYLSMLK